MFVPKIFFGIYFGWVGRDLCDELITHSKNCHLKYVYVCVCVCVCVCVFVELRAI